jgi:hypothetical protein
MPTGRYTMKVDAWQYDSEDLLGLANFTGPDNIDAVGYPVEIWVEHRNNWFGVYHGDHVVKFADYTFGVVRDGFESRFEPE